MVFLIFEVTPGPNHPEVDDIGGAFVSCWIDRPTLQEAERVARDFISQEGWVVGDFDEAYPVGDAAYPSGSIGRPRFEQALVDREVFLFHTYPVVDHD